MKLTRYLILFFLFTAQINWAQQNKKGIQSSAFNYDTLNKIIING